MASTVELNCSDGIATLLLDRPASLNSFNAQMRRELSASLLTAVNASDVRVIIVSGKGDAFSAGADLREKYPEGQTVEQRLEYEYKPILMTLVESPKPVIAAVNGIAAGIACSLVQSCDLVVMAESGSFYLAFSAVGLIPDGGASWHLVRQLGPKRAYEMMALGEKMSSARCLELGLVNKVVPDANVITCARDLGQQLISRAPLSLYYSKKSLQLAMHSSLQETMSAEARFQLIANQSDDHQEGRRAFLEKRSPRWTGK